MGKKKGKKTFHPLLLSLSLSLSLSLFLFFLSFSLSVSLSPRPRNLYGFFDGATHCAWLRFAWWRDSKRDRMDFFADCCSSPFSESKLRLIIHDSWLAVNIFPSPSVTGIKLNVINCPGWFDLSNQRGDSIKNQEFPLYQCRWYCDWRFIRMISCICIYVGLRVSFHSFIGHIFWIYIQSNVSELLGRFQ